MVSIQTRSQGILKQGGMVGLQALQWQLYLLHGERRLGRGASSLFLYLTSEESDSYSLGIGTMARQKLRTVWA